MPPKTRRQPGESTRPDGDQSEIEGDPDERVQPAMVPGATADTAVTALAQMFKSFMEYQKDRDDRQEREAVRREQHFKVLSHHVTQMQLDMERIRHGEVPDKPAPKVIDREPRLARLEDSDDIEHYLLTFERLAEVYQWPKEDWAIHLIPLLTGKARSAFVAMDPSHSQDYDCVKTAILKKYEINAETYRLRFRNLNTPADESPQELYTRLKDLFCKWVRYSNSTKEDIMEALVLEQFLRVLYPDVRTWVKERGPATAAEAARLAEAYITARKGAGNFRYAGILPSARGKSEGSGDCSNSQAKIVKLTQSKATTHHTTSQNVAKEDVVCFHCGQPGHTRPLCPLKKPKTASLCYVPHSVQSSPMKCNSQPVRSVLLNGRPVLALVDTGCTYTLVQSRYVPREDWNDNETVTVCCVHGENTPLPTAEVYIEVLNQSYLMKVGIAETLPYPILLGTDMPVLAELLQDTEWCGVVTRAQSKQAVQTTSVPDPDDALQTLPFCSTDVEAETGPTEDNRLQQRRDWVADLINTAGQASEDVSEPELCESDIVIPNGLSQLQREDPTLATCFDQSRQSDDTVLLDGSFVLKHELLYRQTKEGDLQLVVPKAQRSEVLKLGHSIPWSGHLGFAKTCLRISKRFYWPRMYTDIKEYCQTCPECQLTSGRTPAYAPLIPLPVIDVPFERIGVDVVGPVERSQAGNRFILVISDYATRYPEAYPLRDVTAKQIASALLKFFSQVGIPKEVLTDQGTNFMSRTLQQVYQLLGIKRVRTTPYHPQTDGLVERFNQTLKNMLKKFVSDSGKDWDKWLPYLLFAYREVPQASTGFSPFELLYAHQVRGPLDVLKESWEATDNPKKKNILTYVMKMRDKLQQSTALARENLIRSQVQQKHWYDKMARSRSFEAGEEVLLLLPTSDNKLLAKWQGPYQIKKKVGPVTYQIEIPSRSQPLQTFHVNMLKKWHPHRTPDQEEESNDFAMLVRVVEGEEELEEQYLPTCCSNSKLNLQHLSDEQRDQLWKCIPDQLFMDTPGRTDLVDHSIILKDPKPVRQAVYRVPEKLLPVMKEELQTMKQLGVIEPSSSEWSSPIVLVPKKDGTLRFCLDFRKLNSVSKFDPYPMPRVDELVERLGRAKYLSTLDLCKGYWQVPLKPACKEFTAFRTPFGHYQFRVLPFGLHGAPATFQRMMDQILCGTDDYAAAYLDDIVIFSQSWDEHLQHLKEVLTRIKAAGLTIRPDKCTLAKPETQYLGFVLGHGVIRPQVGKVEAIKGAERPVTKKQVRAFLGLVGWYRKFIPNFSARAITLTNLTKKNQPNNVVWTEDCEKAFKDLKDALCQEPVLQSPDFGKLFTVQTDASQQGIGAVLLQEEQGQLKPVVYISRKLLPREVNYSTVEKECLAVKWALDSLRYYLLGRKFRLETDHRALAWLGRMKDTNARITRWFLAMQPFDFEVLYRSGSQNCTADFLSRTPQVVSGEGGGNVTVRPCD